MTDSEKARAYDEALERAEKYVVDGKIDTVFISDIFPQLAESEDEKIRKALIEMVHDTTGDELWVDYGIHKEEALAWLEKQGKQNPADKVMPKFHEGDSIQFKGFGHNRYTIKEVCGLSHYISTMGNIMDMSYTDANFEVIKDSDKVKLSHAWSEEDEKVLHAIRNALNYEKPRNYLKSRDFEFTDILDWLKSIKERVQPQPKQEWSEEDEKMLQGIWDEVLANKHDAKECEWKTYDRFLSWLKSLRPQNRWMPSDEQMKALANAISLAKNCGEESAFDLRTLYEQLKKLREE